MRFLVWVLLLVTCFSSSIVALPPSQELNNHTAVDVVAQAMASIADSIATMTTIVEKEYAIHRPNHPNTKPKLHALLLPKR